MLFNSIPYLIFLPCVVVLYYCLEQKQRQWMLLIASLFFYSFWSLHRSASWSQRLTDLFITDGLLLITTFVDFNVARWLMLEQRERRRKLILVISIVCNLGMLGIFKYANFLGASFDEWFGTMPWPHLNVVLPPGISFYTFMSMAYVIDVYRRELTARDKLIDFSVFVAYFPHLVAGPILRAKDLLPQMTLKQPFLWDNIRRGLALILWGMFIKVYIADPMAHVVNESYANSDRASGLGLLMATYAFAVQIYCDFSGYSDIAIGSAMLLGVKLPENFRTPYMSLSISEFWRRWHISLSSWLRDYLYFPLGGNRKGKVRTYVNLLVTMLLGGIWHGAGWHWLVWGGIQGVVMSIERLLGVQEKHPAEFWRRVIRWVVTFHIVCLSWVFFRSSGITHAVDILKRIGRFSAGEYYYGAYPVVVLGIVLLLDRIGARGRWIVWISARPTGLRWLTYGAIVALVLTFQGVSNPEFIYFQF